MGVTDKETLKLDGEWKFYPNQFLDPSGNNDTGNKTTVSVPGNWQEEKKQKSSYSYHKLATFMQMYILQ